MVLLLGFGIGIFILAGLGARNKSGMFLRERTAILTIQTIHEIEVRNQARYGHYACSLSELTSTGRIGEDLASRFARGYKFSVTCNAGHYAVSAVPEAYGTSGSRTFYSGQSMVIRQNYGPEPATASSQALQ